jgi:potassium efflux system protein
MLLRRCAIVFSLFAIFTVMGAGAMAQSPQAPAAQPAAPAAPSPAAQAPKVDHAAILKKANEAVGLDVDGRVRHWREELDRIEQGLHNTKADYKALNDFRTALFGLRAEAEEFWKKLEPALNSAADNVQALPPATGQDQAPEPEQAAAYRAETVAYHAYLNSTRGALDGTHNRINKLLGHLLDIRRSKVASNLLQRVPGALYPETWLTAPGQILALISKVSGAIATWWDAQDDDQILPLAGLALAMWLGLSVIGLAGVRRLRRWEDCGEPPFWRRASDAAGIVLLRSLPVILPLVFLFTALEGAAVLPNDISWLFYSGARSIIVIVVVNALVSTALSPADHRWRLIPASNAAAVRIAGLVLTMALLYGTATFLQTAAYLFKAPDSPKLALILLPNTIIALLIVAILQTPLRSERIGGLPSASWLRILRLPIWFLALAIIASAATGYLYLSRFITQQLIVTGAILTIVYLMLLWADGIAQAMGSESSGIGKWLSATGHLDQGSRQRLSVPVSLLLKFGVMLCAIPLILNQWQFSWPDIFEWYRQLFFGFRIGNTQVSLAALFASVVVFALGYFAAKFFQQWLDTQILKPAGLSGGLRDSIRTGVGYVGIAAAALFALSYAGFSLSNLAIVAGAFSVGIGFGLQSVVNNFVSGLILLAERPIKIGDLVVAGGEEGYVRKISVRSTEIETFDGANVLIPNSFFISEKVKNWTLRNNTGRVTIKVNVAHGTVPHQVRAILLQVAQAHPAVMRTPAPVVNFEEIGSDSLEFKLYAFVHDLNTSGSTRTDLRIAILDAFHDAGIAMASQQTDITLRDMDWLRDAVQLYVANALNGHAAENAGRAPVKHEMESSG